MNHAADVGPRVSHSKGWYYVGPKGWVGMRLDRRVDWREVALLVTRSYRMTAPKRLVQKLPAA